MEANRDRRSEEGGRATNSRLRVNSPLIYYFRKSLRRAKIFGTTNPNSAIRNPQSVAAEPRCETPPPFDWLTESSCAPRRFSVSVIPAKAGIQFDPFPTPCLDARLRGHDGSGGTGARSFIRFAHITMKPLKQRPPCLPCATTSLSVHRQVRVGTPRTTSFGRLSSVRAGTPRTTSFGRLSSVRVGTPRTTSFGRLSSVRVGTPRTTSSGRLTRWRALSPARVDGMTEAGYPSPACPSKTQR
jgi:hypothetical protein